MVTTGAGYSERRCSVPTALVNSSTDAAPSLWAQIAGDSLTTNTSVWAVNVATPARSDSTCWPSLTLKRTAVLYPMAISRFRPRLAAIPWTMFHDSKLRSSHTATSFAATAAAPRPAFTVPLVLGSSQTRRADEWMCGMMLPRAGDTAMGRAVGIGSSGTFDLVRRVMVGSLALSPVLGRTTSITLGCDTVTGVLAAMTDRTVNSMVRLRGPTSLTLTREMRSLCPLV